MTRWDTADLDLLGQAQEIQISIRRSDGTWGSGRPIWIVRVGDDLYVRSYHGTRGAWYRGALRDGAALIRTNGLDLTVDATAAGDADQAAIDAAYRAKYSRYGSAYVTPMTAAAARATTLRLTPTV